MNWIRSVLVHTALSLISSLAFGIPNELSHQLSGNVNGKIIFHQMEGNSTFLRDSGKLASCIPTVVSFELSEPKHHLHSETLIYTWDFGNGQVRKGSEPFVKCYYTLPGNYTFKLSIGTHTPQQSKMTGLYSVDLTVLDAIRSIELRGPLIYNVDESSNLSFQVGGSPPVWLCWRVLSDCYTPSSASCNLVSLYGNTLNLSYTFTSVGTYCLDVSVRNNISNLQTSYNIYVQNSRDNNPQRSTRSCSYPQTQNYAFQWEPYVAFENLKRLPSEAAFQAVTLIFILPCAAVIIATLIFISVTVCRPRQQSLMSKAVTDTNYLSFTDIELHVKDATIPLGGNSPASKTNEALPLLHQPGASHNTQPC